MKRAGKIALIAACAIVLVGIAAYYINKSRYNPNPKYALGQPLDSLNSVVVYYNGMVGHSSGRSTSPDGYNIGMKYQCVEFVKRYYYQRWNHKMPDAYGNAKDFFDASLPDSSFNAKRGLVQFANGSISKPRVEDLLIFDGHARNPYGHVCIVSFADSLSIGIVQQNPGPFAASRDTFPLSHKGKKWFIEKERTLGWMRRVDTVAASTKP